MKSSRLFVLSTLGLMSLSVSAADLIERFAPEEPSIAPVFGEALSVDDIVKTPATLELGKIYVAYNVGTDKYLSQGCAWATQASIASVPLAIRFTVPEGKTLADAALLLNDYNLYTNNWKQVFFDSETAMFTDYNNQANYFFNVIPQGDKVYRLQASSANPTLNPEAHPGFVGRDETVTYTGDMNGRSIPVDDAEPLSPFLEEGEGHYLDWQFFEVPELSEWEDYFAALDAYNLSQKLKTLIEAAEEMGVDISAAEAVYNNENASAAEISAAMEALQKAMASGIENGSAENPADATSMLQNPNFDNASSDGWSGSKPNMTGSGAHGPANVAEFYQGSNVDIYQELAGLPNGVYRVEMFGFYRSGNSGPAYDNYVAGENYRAKLYATADGEKLVADLVNPFEIQNTTSFAGPTDWGVDAGESNAGGFYIPNDPSCARVYFDKGWYKNTLFFYVSDGKARVGITEEGANLEGDWMPFDEFTLTYYGDSEASFGKWVELSAPNFENAIITTSLLEDYQTGLAALIASAKDKASALDAVEKVKELAAPLKANSSLWAQWLSALAGAEQYTTGEYGDTDAAAILGEYISFEGEEQKENPTWDDETIKAEIEKIADMIKAIKDELNNKVQPNTDVTDLYIGLDDAKFVNGRGGWTVEGDGVNAGAGCLEAYDQQFDLYKIVEGPQVGVYELELQGFFRLERDQTAFDMYTRGEQDKTRAWIYLNDVKSYVKCVFDEEIPGGYYEDGTQGSDGQYWVDGNTDNWYPNTMTSANEAFNAGLYKTKAYGLVANAGEQLRLGVAGNMKGANWMIWDNFKLTYLGFEAATIKPILQEALENMESLDQPMGKDIYAKAQDAKKAAEEALNGNDGKVMFDALTGIWSVNAEISSSVILFKKLKDAAESLNELIGGSANTEAVAQAGEFYETVTANIQQNAYNDEDVPALMKQIKGLRYMLRMPAEIVAGTDLTNVIENPEYSNDEGSATSEGWEGTTAAVNGDVMNAEIFNAESFDHYQEIPGLPAGQYEVTVNAYYRAGNGPADYTAYQEDKNANNNAVLYANNKTQILHRLAEFASSDNSGDGWVEVAENSGLYVPNSMSTAATLFDEQGEAVKNTVVGIVGADGVLRIGLKKDVALTDDWCLFDTWTLKYLGEAATKEGDVNGDGSVNVADISAIISVMAGEAPEFAATADVNGDGSVNVADISAVIDIMAASARAAKAIEE